MSKEESPTSGPFALARAPAADERERRALLLWRGLLAAATLAAYTLVALVAATLALLPIAGRRAAGRRVPAAEAAGEADGSERQALPG